MFLLKSKIGFSSFQHLQSPFRQIYSFNTLGRHQLSLSLEKKDQNKLLLKYFKKMFFVDKTYSGNIS